MQDIEREQLEARREERRKEIRGLVASIRQKLAQAGYPVPDDTTDEEIIVSAQFFRDVVEGRVQPPNSESGSSTCRVSAPAGKTPKIIH